MMQDTQRSPWEKYGLAHSGPPNCYGDYGLYAIEWFGLPWNEAGRPVRLTRTTLELLGHS